MMFDLIQHIANKNFDAVVPLVNGMATYQQRKIRLSSDLHGWYVLNIGNKIDVIREASLKEIREMKMKTFLGFSFGESIVPVNFENFDKANLSSSEPIIYFGRISRDWSIIRVAFTEDRKLIFAREEENVKIKKLLRQIKDVFDKEEVLGPISMLTPEMRFLFFNHSLLRQQQKEMERLAQLQLEKEKLEEAVREFNKTVEGRIRFSLAQSGARLINFKKLSQREDSNIQVVWEVTGHNGRVERVSSLIRHDSLAVVPAGLGFCASGGDTTQTLSSAPVLAKEYMKETGHINITRMQGLESFVRDDYYEDEYDDY